MSQARTQRNTALQLTGVQRGPFVFGILRPAGGVLGVQCARQLSA